MRAWSYRVWRMDEPMPAVLEERTRTRSLRAAAEVAAQAAEGAAHGVMVDVYSEACAATLRGRVDPEGDFFELGRHGRYGIRVDGFGMRTRSADCWEAGLRTARALALWWGTL